MVPILMAAMIFTAGMAANLPKDNCPELIVGKSLSLFISPKQPACVTITVISDEATQVKAEHPDDLVLHVSTGKDILADGFEFGVETITVTAVGRHRIQISLTNVTAQENLHATVYMSRKDLPLQTAVDWQAAEALATDSKHSPKISNIVASLERWQALQDASSVARTWLKLGDALWLSGELSRAQDAYERALEICRSIKNMRCIAEAANNSGYIALQLGDIANSSVRLDEAAKDWQELSFPLNQGKTLSNLGMLYSHSGDYQRAISTYDDALILLRSRDVLAHARALNNLGLCYLSLAQYVQAKIYFQKAISAESKLPEAKGDWFGARINFGRMLMMQGHFQQAKAAIEKVLGETEKGPYRSLHSRALNNLGQTLLRLGLADDAKARLTEALKLHRALGDKRFEAVALHYLGIIARKEGDIPLARELLNHSLEIRRSCGLLDDAADSLFALAELEFAAGDSTQVQRLAEQAMTLLELIRNRVPGASLRASFYARRRNLLDLLVEIAMRPDNQNAVTDGLIAAEFGRSRSLLDILAEREQSSLKPADLVDRQTKIRRQINFLSLIAADESKAHENVERQLEVLIAEDQQVEAHIRESIEAREAGARRLTTVAPLQQNVLSPQSAILEYHLGERSSHVWLVHDQKIEEFLLPPRAIIERQVSAAVILFAKIQERRRNPALQHQYLKAMAQLSATLLGKLKGSELPPFLILILDGDLYRVPFAALRLPKGGYLGIQHDLMQAPSAAFLLQGSPQEALAEFPKLVLALYDPVFSGTQLPRLPFKDEIQVIMRLVPRMRRDLLKRFDANVPMLKSLPLEQYGILHFSTHAIVNDELPELSRIALSVIDRKGRPLDGFLFPYQLADLHLHHSIVVLSACDTALGKKVLGEGFVGFTSSLFSAGASKLVLTLTEVDAQASSIFLANTYRRILARNPETMEHALTLARQRFLHSGRWSDPYYWASFVAVGRPSGRISAMQAAH